ncbi:efflux RND transporter periplasmic adaptor subunit [Hyphomicrobium sp.]|uniref:efflux RND transporter periplasmic adaptor subunit n=1 Tax=Hyphomicrobium sp. TaxID=82 RepID=UPI002FDC83B0
MARRIPIGTLALVALFGSASIASAQRLTLSPEQVERMEIKLAEVKSADTEAVAVLPGTIVPALNARLVAAASFAGSVIRVFVLPGQTVAKGAPLAVIESRDLLDALSQLKQAEAELQIAEAVAARKRDLANKGIANALVADEAEAQVIKIGAVLEQHKRTLSLGGLRVGEGGQYTIVAPESGVVIDTQATPGATLAAMAPAITIATRPEVWVEAQVPAELVTRIRPGDAVQVMDGPQGAVISISGSLDRTTRSALMLASIPAGSGLLPGQMVTLSLLRPTETGGLDVPAAAVAWIGKSHVMFVRSDAGFTLTPVTVRGRSPLRATVAGDVRPGQEVAANGLPQLEAMLSGE